MLTVKRHILNRPLVAHNFCERVQESLGEVISNTSASYTEKHSTFVHFLNVTSPS